jgi:hypothetical protein
MVVDCLQHGLGDCLAACLDLAVTNDAGRHAGTTSAVKRVGTDARCRATGDEYEQTRVDQSVVRLVVPVYVCV